MVRSEVIPQKKSIINEALTVSVCTSRRCMEMETGDGKRWLFAVIKNAVVKILKLCFNKNVLIFMSISTKFIPPFSNKMMN